MQSQRVHKPSTGRAELPTLNRQEQREARVELVIYQLTNSYTSARGDVQTALLGNNPSQREKEAQFPGFFEAPRTEGPASGSDRRKAIREVREFLLNPEGELGMQFETEQKRDSFIKFISNCRLLQSVRRDFAEGEGEYPFGVYITAKRKEAPALGGEQLRVALVLSGKLEETGQAQTGLRELTDAPLGDSGDLFGERTSGPQSQANVIPVPKRVATGFIREVPSSRESTIKIFNDEQHESLWKEFTSDGLSCSFTVNNRVLRRFNDPKFRDGFIKNLESQGFEGVAINVEGKRVTITRREKVTPEEARRRADAVRKELFGGS